MKKQGYVTELVAAQDRIVELERELAESRRENASLALKLARESEKNSELSEALQNVSVETMKKARKAMQAQDQARWEATWEKRVPGYSKLKPWQREEARKRWQYIREQGETPEHTASMMGLRVTE